MECGCYGCKGWERVIGFSKVRKVLESHREAKTSGCSMHDTGKDIRVVQGRLGSNK